MKTVKVNTIKVDELEDLMKFARLERDLVVRLTLHKETKEREIQELKKINSVAKQLYVLKEKHHFKTSDELVKAELKRLRYNELFG